MTRILLAALLALALSFPAAAGVFATNDAQYVTDPANQVYVELNREYVQNGVFVDYHQQVVTVPPRSVVGQFHRFWVTVRAGVVNIEAKAGPVPPVADAYRLVSIVGTQRDHTNLKKFRQDDNAIVWDGDEQYGWIRTDGAWVPVDISDMVPGSVASQVRLRPELRRVAGWSDPPEAQRLCQAGFTPNPDPENGNYKRHVKGDVRAADAPANSAGHTEGDVYALLPRDTAKTLWVKTIIGCEVDLIVRGFVVKR
jgi:hypothetical protein